MSHFKPVFRQGSMSMSIDALVAQGLPVPRHIKIDVDRFEDRVIDGAWETLALGQTASLLIEINPQIDAHRQTVKPLKAWVTKPRIPARATLFFAPAQSNFSNASGWRRSRRQRRKMSARVRR